MGLLDLHPCFLSTGAIGDVQNVAGLTPPLSICWNTFVYGSRHCPCAFPHVFPSPFLPASSISSHNQSILLFLSCVHDFRISCDSLTTSVETSAVSASFHTLSPHILLRIISHVLSLCHWSLDAVFAAKCFLASLLIPRASLPLCVSPLLKVTLELQLGFRLVRRVFQSGAVPACGFTSP